MPFKSVHPYLEIPQTNLVDYLFPPGHEPSNEPLWIDAQDPSNYLSEAQVLKWSKSFSRGLSNAGLRQGEVVMLFTPNHVFVPVAYLGIVGGGYRFSAANPAFTLRGEYLTNSHTRFLMRFQNLSTKSRMFSQASYLYTPTLYH
jgi:4-coumarate--CoA ligase